eukprot:5116576-Amphidinium_carterae.1
MLPNILCLQEHHVRQQGFDAVQALLRKYSYQIVFDAAQRGKTETATVGGTAICVRTHIGMCPVRVPSKLKGRCAGCTVNGLVKGGFTLFTVYLRPSVGIKGNQDLLVSLADMIVGAP